MLLKLFDAIANVSFRFIQPTLSFELKAESLLTSLLREKLHTKELEVEQLQAELAAAVRGNDILCCEVQNALDSLSSGTHKFKDLELQVILNIPSLLQRSWAVINLFIYL